MVTTSQTISPGDQQSTPLAVLVQVLAAIGHETAPPEVLASILTQILAISQAELGAFLVTNAEANRLLEIARQDLPSEVMSQFTQGEWGYRLLKGQQVWLKPQPLQINADQILLERQRLNYLVGLPMCLEGRVVGGIVLGSRLTNGQSLRQQQRWLATLAQLTALYLENINLRSKRTPPAAPPVPVEVSPTMTAPHDVVENEMEQLLAAVMASEEEVANHNQDLNLLNTLSTEIGGTFQLNAILKTAVKQTQSALNVKACWCYLWQEGLLILGEHQGLSEQYVTRMRQLTPGNGVEGMAFSRHEPVLRDGALFHDGQTRALVQAEGLKIVAAVPLQLEEQTFGVLAVAQAHDWIWSARDQRLLTSISRQVAQALANSQKFTTVQEKAQTWEADYSTLQQNNTHLIERTQILEQHLQVLHQAEQQIWTTLAASQKSRHQAPGSQVDEALSATLKKVLTTMKSTEYPLVK